MDVSRFCNDEEQLNDKEGWTRGRVLFVIPFLTVFLMPVVFAIQGILHTQRISAAF